MACRVASFEEEEAGGGFVAAKPAGETAWSEAREDLVVSRCTAASRQAFSKSWLETLSSKE